jgi:hypothetical protein
MSILPIHAAHVNKVKSVQVPAEYKDLLDAEKASEEVSTLYSFVINHASAAKAHRMRCGVDNDIASAIAAANAVYTPEECSRLKILPGTVYYPLIATKVRAFKAWASDILLNNEDKPWTLAPSPIPELPKEAEDVVVEHMMEELRANGLEGDIISKLKTAKIIAKKHVKDVSKTAALNMEDVIHDQLLVGGWRAAFEGFISDLALMPYAVLKGPVVEMRDKVSYANSTVAVKSEPTYVVKHVDPRDFYPSADSSTPNDGLYIIEKQRMSRGELQATKGVSSFNSQAIDRVVADHPGGWAWTDRVTAPSNTDGDAKKVTDVSDSAAPAEDTGGLFHVVVYYGKISSEFLEGISVEIEQNSTVEAEVWVTGGQVIRAILNPYPNKKRPFYVTSFDKNPRTMFGKGLEAILRDIARVSNACVRSLTNNMAYSSGPILEASVKRMAQGEDIDDIYPGKVFKVDDKEDFVQHNIPAIRSIGIDSRAGELLSVHDAFKKEGDDVSGLPAYVLGNPQVAGAGRTLGGLSLLMGNAAKGMKKVLLQTDKDIIEPLIEAYVFMNLKYNQDQSIKFDTQVVARGSSGLLKKELSQARAVDVLNTLVPFANTGLVSPDAIKIVLRDVIKGLGDYGDDVVPDPRRQREIERYIASNSEFNPSMVTPAANGAPSSDGGSAQPLPGMALPTTETTSPLSPGAAGLPKLDGRSQP